MSLDVPDEILLVFAVFLDVGDLLVDLSLCTLARLSVRIQLLNTLLNCLIDNSNKGILKNWCL